MEKKEQKASLVEEERRGQKGVHLSSSLFSFFWTKGGGERRLVEKSVACLRVCVCVWGRALKGRECVTCGARVRAPHA